MIIFGRKGKLIFASVIFVAMLCFWVNYDFTTNKLMNDHQLAKQTMVTTPRVNNVQKAHVDFFIEYKIERDRSRAQQMEVLRELINNKDADQEVRKNAQRRLLETVQYMEKEMKIESLIKAKNFNDAIVFIDADTAEVVVKAAKLEPKQSAQIGDIVNRGTGIPMDKITIIAKK